LSNAIKLTPFSYVILVLVGRDGAGPHDLRRMAEIGRVYWVAAPSQWYAEPKRLLEAGLLAAEKTPGRTRERTHYSLTEAGRDELAAWARTPAAFPRMQHESIVRLLAADLVDPAAVLEGLAGLRPELEEALEHVGGQEEAARRLPARGAMLTINANLARRLLEAQLAWLDEAEELLDR
jgi:DNA-binding PadR family transcriptional regulator